MLDASEFVYDENEKSHTQQESGDLKLEWDYLSDRIE